MRNRPPVASRGRCRIIVPEMPPTSDLVIRHATRVRAAAGPVYDAFTTARGLDGWFTDGARVEAHPGGSILFRWRGWGPDRVTGEDGGPVVEAVRPERFVFRWNPHGLEEATTVEVDFAPDEADAEEEATVVRLLEHGYPDTPAGRAAVLDCAAGWGEALTLLKMYVEHGVRY